MANIEYNNLAFTLNLFNETIKTIEQVKNIIVSPLSIQTCLALAFIGADGKTAEELSSGLGLDSLDKKQVVLNFKQLLSRPGTNSLVKIANKIYVQTKFEIKSEFNKIATENFYTKAENIDFSTLEEATKTINTWVGEQTNKKIQNLIESSALENAHLLLINAIHFKGQWMKPFSTDCTRKDKFWYNENDSIDIDMMYSDDRFKYNELKDLDATTIQLNYNDSELYMLLVVPNKITGLSELEKNLRGLDLSKVEDGMQVREVCLNLPKFKSEYSVELNDVLQKMGITSMFSDMADFKYLTETPVKVDKVVHKAVIEVDEVGTEAAAATYKKIVPRCINFDKKYLKIDRPFLYFIMDSNVVYFMGRVSKF